MYNTYEAVAFPNLGIGQIELDPIMWTIPGTEISIRWYAVFICIGIIVAYVFANYYLCKRFGVKKDDLIDCLLYTLPVAFVGARLTYVIGDIKSFKTFRDVIAIWEGGLAIYGGIIFAALSVFVICKLKKIHPGSMLDIMAIGFLIGQVIGRLGNFVNVEVYGATTDLPWAMALVEHVGDDINMFTKLVHPLFLYEMLWNAIGFVLILGYLRYRKFNGEVFLWYAGWYGLGRGWMEFLRDPEFILKDPIFGKKYFMVVIAAAMLVAAVTLIIIFRRRSEGYVVAPVVEEDEPEDDGDYERQFNITKEDLDAVELSAEEMEAKQLFEEMEKLVEEEKQDDVD